MKILICDDDKMYVDSIKAQVDAFLAENSLTAQCCTLTSADGLMTTTESYDIAFLDIVVGDVSGIEVGKRLKENNENIVIFIVTAYDKYLDDAMDLNVLRFLKKPLNNERLQAGLEKAFSLIDNTTVEILIKDGIGAMNIPISSIMYVEIMGRKIKVVTKDNVYITSTKMTFWQEKLIASFFYQVHKSFIINLKYATNYQKDAVTMKNGDKIPVAFRKQIDFQKYFFEYFTRNW